MSSGVVVVVKKQACRNLCISIPLISVLVAVPTIGLALLLDRRLFTVCQSLLLFEGILLVPDGKVLDAL